MKIIVLVAGLGSRLGGTSPKPLTLLSNNETLLGRQVDLLSKIPKLANSEILLVTGFGHQEIVNSFPNLSTVFNPEFSTTNTSKSLSLGLANITDDVLFLNGDLFYTEDVLKTVTKGIFEQEDNLVFYKSGIQDEEAMKVAFQINSRGAYVTDLGKQLLGLNAEAIGINFIRKNHLETFKQALKDVSPTSYFEEAIKKSISQNGLKFKAVDLGSEFIKEVDFLIDLSEVNRFLNTQIL
jgi:choline kinase